MPIVNQETNRVRGIYLLPNFLTTGSLFAGFYSIVAAMKGHFDVAAVAVFLAMLLDGLDGRVARLTNTQSAFGAEYDSLSDMVCFGIAPPLVTYSWLLSSLGKLGWLAAFIYTAATALRLARFNTQLGIADKRYFQGLSCTASAGIVAGLVWVGNIYHVGGHIFSLVAAVIMVLCALLMVSKVRYLSFKEVNLHDKVSFIKVLLIVLIFVAVALDPSEVLCLVFVSYGLSGPILTLWSIRKRRQVRKTLNVVQLSGDKSSKYKDNTSK